MVYMRNKAIKTQFQPHLILPENTQGRDFVVSDLHGHHAQLEAQLTDLGFDQRVDRLLCVGDLIDRGPQSMECLALLDEPWFYSVRGNHEQMLIDTVAEQTDTLWSRWLMNGGSWVLNEPDSATNQWSAVLNRLPLTITVPCRGSRIGICHAEYNDMHWGERYEADEATQMEWIWGRSRLKADNKTPINGIDWVFSGHTIVPHITELGNSVFIECGAYLENPLTIIDLEEFIVSR